MKKDSISTIAAMWCDDITFCQEECENTGCPRNQKNILDRTIPHSFFVDLPPDCPNRADPDE